MAVIQPAWLLLNPQSAIMPGIKAGQKKAPIWTMTWAAQTRATRCPADRPLECCPSIPWSALGWG